MKYELKNPGKSWWVVGMIAAGEENIKKYIFGVKD